MGKFWPYKRNIGAVPKPFAPAALITICFYDALGLASILLSFKDKLCTIAAKPKQHASFGAHHWI